MRQDQQFEKGETSHAKSNVIEYSCEKNLKNLLKR